jgi:DNA-binding transcriptional LysR family regulator
MAVLLEERSTTRAALRLGVGQSSVSSALGRLRGIFRDPLFLRRPHGLEPTARAMALEASLRPWIAQADRFSEPPVFDPRTATRSFIVSATDYAQTVLLPHVLADLRRQGPNLRLAVLPRANADEAITDGRLDILLTPKDKADPRHRQKDLLSERYTVAMRRGHPLASKPLTIDAFCSAGHILLSLTGGDFDGVIDQALERVGRTRHVVVSTFSFHGALELAKGSDLLAVLPERLVRRHPDLVMLKPPMKVGGWTLTAFWPAQKHDEPGHIWLRQIFTAAAKKA